MDDIRNLLAGKSDHIQLPRLWDGLDEKFANALAKNLPKGPITATDAYNGPALIFNSDKYHPARGSSSGMYD